VRENRLLRRYDVAVLGARGRVAIEYLEMLKQHPWFRVVMDGHLESVYLECEGEIEEPERVLDSFVGLPQELKLPSAPEKPIVVRIEGDRPQPRLDPHGRAWNVDGGRKNSIYTRLKDSPVLLIDSQHNQRSRWREHY
jgi:aspartate-semialdehyde dehydrogenase